MRVLSVFVNGLITPAGYRKQPRVSCRCVCMCVRVCGLFPNRYVITTTSKNDRGGEVVLLVIVVTVVVVRVYHFPSTNLTLSRP